MRIQIPTPFGLESVVCDEVRSLGFTGIKTETGRITLDGDLLAVARLNVHLRTAERVRILVTEFPCKTFDDLFSGIESAAWEKYLPPEAAMPVAGRSAHRALTSVPRIQATTKKAIVNRLLRAHCVDTLPETGAKFPVEIAVGRERASVSIDTSGDALHKRGYRSRAGEAPLKETLAAAIICLSGWRGETPLVDPFCGSGTIAIEAALLASGRRVARSYLAEAWVHLFRDEWARARGEMNSSLSKRNPIIASDIDNEAIRIARENAKRAGVEDLIEFRTCAAKALQMDFSAGVVVTNPPYGQRLKLGPVYSELRKLRSAHPGFTLNILSGDRQLEREMKEHATWKRKLFNGRIQVNLHHFRAQRTPTSAQSGASQGA